jgi:HK97 family phage prohead protease
VSKLDKLFSRDVTISKISKSSDDSDSPDIFIEGYANFGAKDRVGDLIDPSVWSVGESLNNFKKNPILLFNHDYDEPVGKVEDVEPRSDGLFIRAKITSAAGKVYRLIADGVLSTFSVGFRLLDAKWIGETETFLITKLELLEISVVSVPCQQDSVFSLAKSMNGEDYLAIRKTFGPNQSTIIGAKKNMGDETQLNIDELAAKLGLSNLAKNVDAILAAQQKEADEKAARSDEG